MTGQFLSTPSARRATRRWTIVTRLWRFLSTPSARRATMPRGTTPAPPTNFYPRPPRGGRHRQHLPWRTDQDFYPRPPRGGRRSTPRVRGDAADISIHALREEGDTSRSSRRRWWSYFYPRPPRGGRRFSSAARARSKKFLSTPSARRATKTVGDRHKALEISIHALREEGDPAGYAPRGFPESISIHALREEGDA